MKFKLERIEGIYNALTHLCKYVFIPKTSYWLGKFKTKVKPEFEEYQEQEGKLRNRYGVWKYRLEKETVVDGKPVREVKILSLKGPEKQKHWEDEVGNKVEFTEELNPKKIFWEGNTDEDTLAFKEELKALQDLEFEIPYEPIKLNRLVRKNIDKEEEVDLPGELLAELDGIIVDEEVPVKEEAAA